MKKDNVYQVFHITIIIVKVMNISQLKLKIMIVSSNTLPILSLYYLCTSRIFNL